MVKSEATFPGIVLSQDEEVV